MIGHDYYDAHGFSLHSAGNRNLKGRDCQHDEPQRMDDAYGSNGRSNRWRKVGDSAVSRGRGELGGYEVENEPALRESHK